MIVILTFGINAWTHKNAVVGEGCNRCLGGSGLGELLVDTLGIARSRT